VYKTPRKAKDAKGWVQIGFSLYEHLGDLGYQPYPTGKGDRRLFEVVPEACYHAWLGQKPLAKRSLEGCLQRQLVLYDLGLDIPDPMLFFEEITRHRLLQGVLPEDELYKAAELQALAAAYVAWLIANRPEEVNLVGDEDEGQIALPAK
jgi:hypothetical protein